MILLHRAAKYISAPKGICSDGIQNQSTFLSLENVLLETSCMQPSMTNAGSPQSCRNADIEDDVLYVVQ
jgi:hypothetical protein